MRNVLILAAIAVGCGGHPHGDDVDFTCEMDDAGVPGVICHCFDGSPRCNTACPVDLTAPCTFGATCGDLSGGSDGGDCDCTCDGTGHYVCGTPDNSCVPQQ